MNRQDYNEAAEHLLDRATKTIEGGYTDYTYRRVEQLTDMARVYAMLAAIPDTQDHVPHAQNI